MIEASGFYRDFLALARRWKREHDRSATPELALNLHGALVKIDNRFYKRETEPRALGAARGLSAVETVEYARQMFRLNAGAIVSELRKEIARHEDAVASAHGQLIAYRFPGAVVLEAK